MADGWSTEQGHYSPYHFYVSSIGENGGRVTYRVNVPDRIAALLQEAVQSGKFPDYRTVQDVFRDAMHHRLKFLADMVGDVDMQEAVAAEMRQALIDKRLRRLEQQKHYVDSLDLLLKNLRSTGDTTQVLEVLEEQDPALLPEAWRERATQVIQLYKEEQEGSHA